MHKMYIKASIIEKTTIALRSLSKNWDNYGSPEVSYRSLNSFENFGNRFFKFFYLRYSIMAVSGGGIQLDFNFDKKMISFEFFPDGSIGFEKFENLGSDGNLIPECSALDINNINIADNVNDLLKWLIQ